MQGYLSRQELNINRESRCELLSGINGTVLSFGCGNEPAMPCLFRERDNITKYIGVDSNYLFEDVFTVSFPFEVEFHTDLENIPSVSVDNIISSHALSSVNNELEILEEYDRILRKNGRIYFFEHFQSEEDKERKSIRYRMQQIFSVIYRALGDREYKPLNIIISLFLENKDFEIIDWEEEYIGHILYATDPHILAIAKKK